jgi:23S rRNA pseudouridine1911/1915/1917 synthase
MLYYQAIMEKIKITVTEENNKERLDKALAGQLPDHSRSFLQNLIKKGEVKVNGQVESNISVKIQAGDEIEVEIGEPQEVEIKPADNIELDIIYEDEHLIVLNKQAGLTVHPGAGNYEDTLVNALIAQRKDQLSGINGELRPGIVHRLDRETSGLMLVAKNDFAHNFLANAIREKEVERVYHALVWNSPELPQGKISANIGRHPKDRKKQSVLKRSGKEAVTHFKLLKSFCNNALSLIECKLETGRTHQIRVHFDHKKMPLIGDQVYSGNPNIKKTGSLPSEVRDEITSFSRQFLHSKRISFEHPESGECLEFEIDYPDDMKKILKLLEG